MNRREGDDDSEREGSPTQDDPVSPALRSVLSAIPTPALACDPETHTICAANSPAVVLLDRDPAALRHLRLSTLADGETASVGETTVNCDSVESAIDRALDADGATAVTIATSAGGPAVDASGSAPLGTNDARRRIELTPRLAAIDGEEWLIVGLADITDRVRAESRLESQLRVTEAIAATLPGALFECTANGTLARWNDQFAADTGYEERELSTTELTSLFIEPEPNGEADGTETSVTETLRRVYRDGEVVDREVTLLTRHGERVAYRLTLGPITDGDEVVGAVGIGEDVAASALREERLSVLTRVLRHNFRNDLNVVTGFTERAIEATDDPQRITELERVVATAERLLRVGETARKVERLLADRPSPQPLDLRETVVEAIASLPAELRERAEIGVDVSDGVTVSAIGYLAEALAELVDNAIRHSDTDRPRVEISAAELPSESWASLVVADDGPGIPPAERAVLTGAETPLEHASGLGLWYVSWIVSASGGNLDITESGDGGSRIEIELRTVETA
ncbi:sensor histidine kinase [Halorubrum laminariae]|uniref:ATP-binding protein n=1 Tax=Halorubrum laminariae TaxID=1433523 RepID=A0ABD6BZH2_9EURY|nr:PAS domain-containing sensor histidine kinase [Halorubrum laminariae]